MDFIIRQPARGAEARAVTIAGLVGDIKVRDVEIGDLAKYSAELSTGKALPVGSVEYLREAMRIGSINEPMNISYPSALSEYLHRNIRQIRAGSVLGEWFVKPLTYKRFNGFVFNTLQDPAALVGHDRQQYDIFMSLDEDEIVWASEPVVFESEWRYYIQDGKIIGSARYDPDGRDDAAVPSLVEIQSAMNELEADPSFGWRAYALDMGVIQGGETALVELTDAWALGLYANTLTGTEYVNMLDARWSQMANEQSETNNLSQRSSYA